MRTPVTEGKIPVHRTNTYPLPTMNIDESSTTGNAEVVDTVFTELGHNFNSRQFCDTVRIVNGDQLSIARLRGSRNNHVGHDSIRRLYLNLILANGLFHSQLHIAFGTLETHWGNPSLGQNDPGSLSFHETVLNRKPIILSSLPPYRTCCELVLVSLYARVLYCLEVITKSRLEDYGKKVTFCQLEIDATVILDRFASGSVVDKLCTEHGTTEAGTLPAGDMVYENAILMLRDGLIMQEFSDAIKCGNSGRIILSLQTLALYYCGSGRTKYAYEILVLCHNLKHVWPKPLR